MNIRLGESEQALVDEYPWIPWLEPQAVQSNGTERVVCRFCTALNGLKAIDLVHDGFRSREQWARHVERDHNRR